MHTQWGAVLFAAYLMQDHHFKKNLLLVQRWLSGAENKLHPEETFFLTIGGPLSLQLNVQIK